MRYVISKVIFILVSAIFFLGLMTAKAYAVDTLILSGDKNMYTMGLHMKYLEDPSGKLAIEDVSSEEYTDNFI
jgi:hypothetical protein